MKYSIDISDDLMSVFKRMSVVIGGTPEDAVASILQEGYEGLDSMVSSLERARNRALSIRDKGLNKDS